MAHHPPPDSPMSPSSLPSTSFIAGRSVPTPALGIAALEPSATRLTASPDPAVADAIARFAGKVAHELNNALTAISSYGELLLEDLPAGAAAREDAVEILAATRRAAALSQTLQQLGRPVDAALETLDITRWAAGIEPRLQGVLGEERTLLVDAPAQPLVVAVDPLRLAGALDALVANAREATAPGGHCTVRVERVSVREHDPEFPSTLRGGRYARIVVLDDGCGMDPAVLARAAEPLAGTKRGSRRGMGLALVDQFVRAAGGALQLRSAAGSGTAAALYLPAITARTGAAR